MIHFLSIFQGVNVAVNTLPETNSKFAPENGWLEYDFFFPFGAIWAYFQVQTCWLRFREGKFFETCFYTTICWVVPPPSNSHKWRFIGYLFFFKLCYGYGMRDKSFETTSVAVKEVEISRLEVEPLLKGTSLNFLTWRFVGNLTMIEDVFPI